ncbi:MAG: type II toxin-antitoxin system RelE/ParE family toxin [Candidatus Methylacidiphilales bacterium]
MAEKKIIWTEKAKTSLFVILDFYEKQNGSKSFSEKLFGEIISETKILSNYDSLGKKTDFKNIRELVLNRNSIFYTETHESINIILVWDNRRNPKECYDLLKNKK